MKKMKSNYYLPIAVRGAFKNRIYQLLIILLCCSFCIYLAPVAWAADSSWTFLGSEASYEEVTKKVEDYIKRLGIDSYEYGKKNNVYWNAELGYEELLECTRNGRFEDTVTPDPCLGSKNEGTHSRSITVRGGKGCSSNLMEHNGVSGCQSQCGGFADYMDFVIFGDLAYKGSPAFIKIDGGKAPDIEFHPGDNIRYLHRTYKNEEGKKVYVYHSVFIYKVEKKDNEEDKLFYIECNWGGNCALTYGRSESASTMRSRSFSLWRIPTLTDRPLCDHSSGFDKEGYCNNCRYSFDWNSNRTAMSGSIVPNGKRVAVKARPYDAAETICTTRKTVAVTARVLNAFGKNWYEVKIDGQSEPGYVYCNRTGWHLFGPYYKPGSSSEASSESSGFQTPEITIDNPNWPTALKPGANFGLRGKINTDCGKITSVKGWILYANGEEKWFKEYNPNKSSHDLRKSLNKDFKFGKLEEGSYIYRVEATAVNGDKTTTAVLINEMFTVGNGTSAETDPPAQAVSTYTVCYFANGGSGEMADTEMTVGKSSPLRANSFTREGYVFSGWAASPDGAVKYADQQSVSLSNNGGVCIDLYAQWTPLSGQNEEEPPAVGNSQVAENDYTGLWENDLSGSNTINVYEQNGQNISVEVTSIKLSASGASVSAIDITKIENIPMINGQGSKEYTDSWNNRGIIHLSFSGDSLRVDYEIIEEDPLARWGIDRGAGSYHRSAGSGNQSESGIESTITVPGTSIVVENPFYVFVDAVEAQNGNNCRIKVRIQEYYAFSDDMVMSLSVGDEIFANGTGYRIRDLDERESGRCYLEYGNMLIRSRSENIWILCWPSYSKVFRELGTTELDVLSDAEIRFDQTLLQLYGEGIQSLSLAELLSGYDVFRYYPCKLTLENGVVKEMAFEYKP